MKQNQYKNLIDGIVRHLSSEFPDEDIKLQKNTDVGGRTCFYIIATHKDHPRSNMRYIYVGEKSYTISEAMRLLIWDYLTTKTNGLGVSTMAELKMKLALMGYI